MNAGPLPDSEFQVPGDLPSGFDWEGYTIDCQNTAKTMTIRVGIIEGANTVSRNFLLPGDWSCRTVGSAGRYVKDAKFGVVIPVRRDERSTLMAWVKNPDGSGQVLEARCRYYISCAPPPASQIKLVPNKGPIDPTKIIENKQQGFGQGFATFASFRSMGAGLNDPNAVSSDGDASQIQHALDPVDQDGEVGDVEEAPNMDFEQMEASEIPQGFDAGGGQEWKGKIATDDLPEADPVPQQGTGQTPDTSAAQSTAPAQTDGQAPS